MKINDRVKGRGSRIDGQGLQSCMELQDVDQGGVSRNNPIINLVIYSFRHLLLKSLHLLIFASTVIFILFIVISAYIRLHLIFPTIIFLID